MEIFSIGFTRKSAEEFFGILEKEGIRRVIDVRLKNTSQLAGFAKRDDLAFFLQRLLDADYHHEPLLAPTEELLTAYRKQRIPWDDYARGYLQLLSERGVAEALQPDVLLPGTVFLCTEVSAERCHRRLAMEYIKEEWPEQRLQLRHL